MGKTQKAIFALYGIFLLSLIPSIIFSLNAKQSFGLFSRSSLALFAQGLLITFLVHSRKQLLLSLGILTCIFTIENTLGIYQIFMLHNFRPEGFQSHPLYNTGIFVIMAPLILAIAADAESYGKTLSKLARLCLPVHFAFFVSSHTRTNWLLLPIVTFIANIKLFLKSKKSICILIICLFVFGCTIATNKKYSNRFNSISNITTDQSNLGRFFIWKVAYDVFQDKPLTGVGMGQFRNYYEPNRKYYGQKHNVLKQAFFKSAPLPHAHNNAMQLLAETGILGFVGFLTFTFGSLFVLAKNWFKAKDSFSLLVFGIFFGYYVLMGMVEPTVYLHRAASRYFWVVVPVLLQLRMLKFKD